jgi:uncharacterized protein YndB with AHSA1/START domain
VIDDNLYLTNVRVDAAVREEWDAFYDEWTRQFASEVPGCRRGSRWAMTEGIFGGNERLPEPGWPVFQAIFEHPRLDGFVLSRSYRAQPAYRSHHKSFDRWFRFLRDYATLHLQRIDRRGGDDASTLGASLLSTMWTIDQGAVAAFDPYYEREVLDGFAPTLDGLIGVHRYVATLAQLHRYGDENGNFVIPQRHHFEDGGRLVYVTLFELASSLPSAARERALADLADRLARATDGLADRQEAFFDRLFVVEHAGAPLEGKEIHAPDAGADVQVREEARRELRWSAEVDVPADRAFVEVATENGWRRWFHDELTMEPRTGGAFRVGRREDMPYTPIAGTVVDLDAPRRVSVRWDRVGGDPRDPLTLTVEVREQAGRGVRVDLLHQGWEHLHEPERGVQLRALEAALGRLKRAVEARTG